MLDGGAQAQNVGLAPHRVDLGTARRRAFDRTLGLRFVGKRQDGHDQGRLGKEGREPLHALPRVSSILACRFREHGQQLGLDGLGHLLEQGRTRHRHKLPRLRIVGARRQPGHSHHLAHVSQGNRIRPKLPDADALLHEFAEVHLISFP